MVNLIINGSCQLVSENNGLKFTEENKVCAHNLVLEEKCYFFKSDKNHYR